MRKYPHNGGKGRSSFPTEDSELISMAEMEIRTDISEEEGGRVEKTSNKIASAVQGLMLGIGACSLSYLGMKELDIGPVTSLLSRVAIGGAAGSTFAYAMYKLADQLHGEGVIAHAKKQDYKSMIKAAVHATLGAVAIGSLGAPLVGAFVDFESNLMLEEELKEKSAKLESYRDEPRSFSLTKSIQGGFNQDIILSLDPHGGMTEKAAAKNLIYNDGNDIILNPTIEPHADLEMAWHFFQEETKFTIGYFEDASSWLIKGPETTWWIGKTGDEEKQNAQELFDRKDLSTSKHSKYKKLLSSSGRIDGISAIDELIEAAGVPPEVGDLTEGIDNLHAFAPFEWNEYWRERVRMNANAVETRFNEEYWSQIRIAYESEFSPSAPNNNANSYFSLLEAVGQIK